ncbi:hypothetical protein PF672P2_00076 [Parabacteroides phage PF672P2]|nr:hypothetical protein PF672P2_00076 [Parabacteroides phage PF672P2]
MKKYIGTRQIEAEPMIMGEAYERGFLRAGRVPNEAEKDNDGYHVKYQDGYESWSPREVFEKAYKVADTPLDRMYVEYNELMDKYNKLVLFLGRKDAGEIAGESQVDLMDLQRLRMLDYLLVLKERIDLIKE